MKTGTKSLIWYYYKSTLAYMRNNTTQMGKPNPSVNVCLANCQGAKLLVEYSSTRRKKQRAVSAKAGHMTERETGRTRTSGGQRVMVRENCTGGPETSGGRRASKRKTGTSETETSGGRLRQNGKTVPSLRKRRAGSAQRNGKPG